MATPINRNHAANIVEKTNRFVTAIAAAETFEPGALDVPASLLDLERTGPLGQRLADAAWATLAEKVSSHTGRTESAPDSTRQAIASACRAVKLLALVDTAG